MREAARALDDVSDHLGEVLRHADALLAEWSRFGGQVRAQVEREAAAIGDVVDGAVTRAASAGLDRVLTDRLHALTGELERLEQRARAASRVVAEQRDEDRRVLWIVVAGIVLANALLVALLLRKPDPAPAAEPIRIESTAAEPPRQAGPAQGNSPATGLVAPVSAATAGSAAAASAAAGATAPGTGAGSSAAAVGGGAGSSAPGARSGAGATPNALATPATPPGNATKQPTEAAGAPKPNPPSIALPPKGGTPRIHKKVP
jgi:hypothetical protein